MADAWSWNNWVDESGTTISGASATGFPAAQLANPQLGRVWRPAAAGSAVTFTFAGQRQVSIIGAFGGGLKPGDRFNLKLSSASTGAFDILSREIGPDIDPISRQWIVRMADFNLSDTVDNVARVQIASLNGADIGRVWCGPADWTPRVNHVYGAEFGAIDYGRKTVSAQSGAVYAGNGPKRRTESVKYDALYMDEVEGPARSMMLLCGTTRQVLYLPEDTFYSREKSAILGCLDEISPIIAAGWERGERAFRIAESG